VPEFVTVHSVRVAKDLRVADVYVTFLDDEDAAARAEAVAALNRSAGFIRGELGRAVRLKYLPALKFHYNPSTHYAADLERIFHKIEHDPPPSAEPD
jgi:ribosome-binding factor A